MPKLKYDPKKGLISTAGSGIDLVSGLGAGKGLAYRTAIVESSAATLCAGDCH